MYKGRKPSIDNNQVKELKERVAAGENKTALAREYDISRQTLYSYLKIQHRDESHNENEI
ncbi:helix-turn-helix domain-containing protein [Colwellia sp. MB3u-4]|uniref:helix-turn-helix domain-containing protein n=1 Tax=Colwellia sp. MB3u-4 TaxID=2759822 RepID=UPI00286FE6AB|nr:helix-turn-helix domain-containing protein [Colwellia sp. MB3u-4]